MKLYIAGKISGLEYGLAYAKFADAAIFLRSIGHEPVNPMEVNGLDGGGNEHPWSEYMRRDIPVLLSCDGIFLLPCWVDSKGARLEKHIADELGMTIVL